MRRPNSIVRVTFTLFLAVLLQSCASGLHLLSTPADPADIGGTYTLLLYGCHYPNDVKDVALLVDEGSKYPLEIYDIDTSYKVKKGVPAKQALSEAESFIRCSTHRVIGTQIRRIPDGSGGTIGFEVRPLYFPLDFGFPDIMLITYTLKDGTVRSYIRLDPNVESAIESSGSNESSSRN